MSSIRPRLHTIHSILPRLHRRDFANSFGCARCIVGSAIAPPVRRATARRFIFRIGKDATILRGSSSSVASEFEDGTSSVSARSALTSLASPQVALAECRRHPALPFFAAASTNGTFKRKEAAPGVFREYSVITFSPSKTRAEQKAGLEAGAGPGRGSSGVSDADVRRAMVNTLDVFSAKTRCLNFIVQMLFVARYRGARGRSRSIGVEPERRERWFLRRRCFYRH